MSNLPHPLSPDKSEYHDWIVYALCDPFVDDPILRIRYIGVTHRTLQQRLRGHLQKVKSGDRTHRSNWIRKLLAAGVQPLIEIVDSGVDDVGRVWDVTEIVWIKHFRDMGCPLTNATDGGQGAPLSLETRAKLSEMAKKRKPSSETRAKIGRALRGRTISVAIRVKISAALKGRVITPEWREKIARSHTGFRHSDETKALISGITKGRKMPEHLVLRNRGSSNGNSRLTEEQVRSIRLRYKAGGVSQQKLADEVGVSQSVVSRIIRKIQWAQED